MLTILRKAALVTLLMLTTSLGLAHAQDAEKIVVYSGRTEGLIGPILEQFTAETGVQVEVRYGSTAEMAATILEEGDNSPADIFISQDAGALGALAAAGRLRALPSDLLERVPAGYASDDGLWVGISGRARALVYNTNLVTADQLPTSLKDLTAPEWAGRVAWAPANGSFQSNVTAMRLLWGEDATREWLTAMVNNDTVPFDNNDVITQAVINGEFAVGLVNHYYVFEFKEQQPDAPIDVHFFAAGDLGNLINVAGVGILTSSQQPGLAQRLALYLLGNNAQTYFTTVTGEYPLVAGIPANPAVKPMSDIQAPAIDLSQLSDLETTLSLLRDVGALP